MTVLGVIDTGQWKIVGSWRLDETISPPLAPMTTLTILAQRSRTPFGISTTVMRDSEQFVLQLVADFKQFEELQNLPDPIRAIHDRATALKSRAPRADAAYGSDLLALKHDLEQAGEQRSIKELSRLLDLPEGTLKTRIRVAERGGRIARPSDLEGDRG